MSRFKVMPMKVAIKDGLDVEACDPNGFLDDYDSYYDDHLDVLVDTKEREVIWRDGMEPEDAILRRDLSWFVKQMNSLAEMGGDD